ncbi:MAG: hypothetical protein NTY53_25650, partial [Kiritimatiellaeota bacterium]|nr:hypothetical protein [Kiritimatiellota bacterium]
MIHRYTRALVYFGLLAGMALSLCGCCRTPVRVNVEDFQSRVAVIGRLGVPIGQAVEIEAVVIAGRELGEKAYQSDYLLKVTQVAGRPLTNPPLFRFKTHSWDHVPLAGDTFALYELKTGRKTGSLDDKQITELERGYVASSVRLLAYEEGFFF